MAQVLCAGLVTQVLEANMAIQVLGWCTKIFDKKHLTKHPSFGREILDSVLKDKFWNSVLVHNFWNRSFGLLYKDI